MKNYPFDPTATAAYDPDQYVATPLYFFRRIDAVFHFDLDACATPVNAKCKRYFTEKQDGLKQVWKGRVWINPPYHYLYPWMRKAYNSGLNGTTVVCLVPVWADLKYWTQFAIKGNLKFLSKRLRFERHSPDGQFIGYRQSRALVLVAFGPDAGLLDQLHGQYFD